MTAILAAKLNRVVHFVFADIRRLAALGESEQIRELAEVAELIPEYLTSEREADLLAIRGGLGSYARKRGGVGRPLSRTLGREEGGVARLFGGPAGAVDWNRESRGDGYEPVDAVGSRWTSAK